MEDQRSEGSFWPLLASVALIALAVAAIRWSLDHPFGIHWDEAQYLNDAQTDVQLVHRGMLLTLGKAIFLNGAGRPPGFRLLALPFLTVFGFHTLTARLVSLVCFGLSCGFIYLATRRIGSQVAAALAVLIFALSPEVVSASIFFGTDAPLYLATAAMFYYAFAFWSNGSARASNWIGLGLAIGLGFLAKTSFVLIALPFLAFWLVAAISGKFGVPGLASQWRAALVAVLIAAPWWLLNAKSAMAYTRYARGFVRNSLGSPSLGTWMRWFNTVLQCLLGHGLSILIALIAIAYLRKAIRSHQTLLDPLQTAALGACASAGVPIVLTQLSGTNHLLRHISPAVIPLAITMGVLSDKAEWGRSRASLVVSSVLLWVQLLMLITPVAFPNDHPVDIGFVNGALPWRTMVRFDQWDWSPVRDFSNRCGIQTPKVAFLGSGRVFNPPAIKYPWVAAASKPGAIIDIPYVKWLWRYEDGPLDWQKVMDLAGQSDIVLTAPLYVGEVRNKEDLDNQHNAEFVERLLRDSRFRGPVRMQMGRFERVEIDLFVKATHACQQGQEAPASR